MRRHALRAVIDRGLRSASRLGKIHPASRRLHDGVEIIRDVAYRDTGSAFHTLDIYRPTDRPGPRPVMFYIHGGGFRILSKDTHWMMGLKFARHGYLVVSINYRLAPEHPFPAAIEDTIDALEWTLENVEQWGGDPGRLSLAGESAGGNLSCALVVGSCYERPEPLARRIFDRDLSFDVVLPACGLLQVSDPERFRARRPDLPGWLDGRILDVSRTYLMGARGGLADPLLVFEGDAEPVRPLPPMIAICGTRDPILDDTRRLGAALERIGTPHQVEIYPGGVHAFHAVFWSPLGAAAWQAQLDFVDRYVDLT